MHFSFIDIQNSQLFKAELTDNASLHSDYSNLTINELMKKGPEGKERKLIEIIMNILTSV